MPAPCTAVYTVMCMLCCGIANVNEMFAQNVIACSKIVSEYPDSYYVLNVAISYGIFIRLKHCKVLCPRSIIFT